MDEEFDYEALGLTPVVVGGNPTPEPAVDEKDPQDDYYTALNAEQRAEFDGMAPDLQDLYRNSGLQVVTSNTETRMTPVAGLGLARDVTPEVQATQKPDDLTYQGIYGDVSDPETGEKVERPGQDFLLRGTAALFDIINDGDPNPIQASRNDRQAQLDRFNSLATDVYADIPGVDQEGGGKVYEQVIRDENGDVVMGANGLPTTNAIAIPDPSSRAWERMGANIVNGVYEQVAGGTITQESDLERSVPNYQQSTGEGLLTDLVMFGAPAAGAAKAVRLGGRLLRIGETAKAGYAARAAMYGATTAAMAFSDAVMSSQGDEGLFVTSSLLQEYLPIENEQAAKDWAMFLDGMVFSGAIDSIMPVVGYGKNFTERRVAGVRAVFDQKFLETRAFEETMLSLVTVLDPTIKEVSGAEGRRRLTAMAEMFSSNAVMDVTLGEVSAQIPRDSATAVLNGAKGYIVDTRQSLKNTMSDADWAAYVDREAATMALSMLSVTRAMGSSPEIVQSSNDMAGAIADTIRRAGAQGLPEGRQGGEFFVENINNLLAERTTRVQAASSAVDTAEDLATSTKNSLDNVATDDPLISEILSEYPDGTGFNRTELSTAIADLMDGPLRQEFNTTWDNVRRMYEDIPNAPIGEDAAAAFQDALQTATENLNTIDASGDKTKRVLGRIYQAILPQGTLDDAGEFVMEDAEEALYRISGVGYQDLYRAKRDISNMIASETNPEVKANLEAINRHITSSGEGGQMSFLLNSGDTATVEAARDADRAFIDARTMFEGSEPMRRYSDMAREARRGDNTYRPEGAPQRGIPDLRAKSFQEVIPTIVGDATGAYTENLMYTMRNMSPDAARPLVEYYEAKTKFELAAALRGGNSSAVNRILDVASNNRDQLAAVGSNLSDTLYEVGASVRLREAELGSAVAAADVAMEAAKVELKAAQDGILSKFINSSTDDLVGNPDSVIRDILFDKQGGDRMRDLLAEVERLPVEQQGLALTALRERTSDILVDELLGSTPVNLRGDSAQYNTMMGRLNTVINGNTADTLGTVQALYKDDPVYFESFTQVLGGLMEANITQRLKLVQAGSDTVVNASIQKDIRDSTSTGLLLLFGYMNPTAATARRLTSQQVAAAEKLADTVGRDTLVAAASNPAAFADMIRAIRNTTDPSIRNQVVEHFGQIVSHGLGYDIRVTEDGDAPLVDRTINAISEAERQTNEAFQR